MNPRTPVATLAAMVFAISGTTRAEEPKAPQPSIDFACDKRQPCTVSEVRSAGTGEAGAPLWVFKLALGPSKLPDVECEQFEYWFTDGKLTQALLHICNDGYGARGIGEDDVQVRPNTFEHSRGGGSSWGWSEMAVVQLSPLRVRSKTSHGSWSFGPNRERRSFDYEQFKGSVSWTAPDCKLSGTAQSEGEGITFDYVVIPDVTLPKDYLAKGWKTAPIGDCGAWVDGEKLGHTVHGTPGPGSDSSMRIVASGSMLLIEVRDDVWTPSSNTWLYDDHVELWLGPKAATYGDDCPGLQKLRAFQWGIRIADGKVFPAAGKPAMKLGVERAQLKDEGGNAVVHLKVQLPRGMEAISVVYSDSDDGKSQERLIATSQLKFKDPVTLGTLMKIPPDTAVCELKDGRLSPKDTRKFTPRTPVIK